MIKASLTEISLINLFTTKSIQLTAEAVNIFRKGRSIDELISILIIHQATEMALKASMLSNGEDIHDKGGNTTVSFERALKYNFDKFKINNKVLSYLNGVRNSVQHHAAYSINSGIAIKDFILDILDILDDLFLKEHLKKYNQKSFINLVERELGSSINEVIV